MLKILENIALSMSCAVVLAGCASPQKTSKKIYEQDKSPSLYVTNKFHREICLPYELKKDIRSGRIILIPSY